MTIFNNSAWRSKLWCFYRAAKHWGADEDVLGRLYEAIDNLQYGEMDTKLYETARLVARKANLDSLAYHPEPQRTRLAEKRWHLEVGSGL